MNPPPDALPPSPREPAPAPDEPSWAAVALVALLAMATFAVTLGGTYIYDDVLMIQEDPRVGDPGLWGRYWTQRYMPGGADPSYRPLTGMSFAVQWWLHGDLPWAFHLANVLLHGAATAAVTVFGGRLFGARIGVAAGVLFAAHPVHAEAVAWIVGRAELMCAAATFTGLSLCLRPLTRARLVGIVACFAVAVLSKDQGLLFPAAVLCLYQVRKRLRPRAAEEVHTEIAAPPDPRERQRLTLLAAALMLALSGYLLYRESILPMGWNRQQLHWVLHPMVRSQGADRALVPVVLVGRYLLLLVAPVKLSIDYGSLVVGWSVRWNEPYFYLGVAAIVGWAVAFALSVKRRSWQVAFCLVAFALYYAIISNFAVLIPTVMGERLMYIPSAFFLLLIAAALIRLPRKAFVAAVLVLAALGAARSVAYARLWDDPVRFWRATIAAQPRSIRAYQLLHEAYIQRGDSESALESAYRCRDMAPDAAESYELIAAAALAAGELDAAEAAVHSAEARGAGGTTVDTFHEIRRRKASLRGSGP